MRAILVDADLALSWTEVPDPTPGPGDILMEIHATAVNRADLLQRAGNYPAPPWGPTGAICGSIAASLRRVRGPTGGRLRSWMPRKTPSTTSPRPSSSTPRPSSTPQVLLRRPVRCVHHDHPRPDRLGRDQDPRPRGCQFSVAIWRPAACRIET